MNASLKSLKRTPLIVIENNEILGVIYLKDVIKDGLVERFQELREMGIETVMCTGDNALTANDCERSGCRSFYRRM